MKRKKNWAGSVQWPNADIRYPDSEDAIQTIVVVAAKQGKKVRVIGSGHSFTPLCQTEDILISLDGFQGIIAVDHEHRQVTVKAGTKLHRLGKLLHAEGLAMENLGDIDRQSIAGTISTGTHGTGITFGTISTQVKAIRFINGNGELVDCSEQENPGLFKAAQVSLGALGIITQITLQCVPAYKLELVNKKEPLEDILSNFRAINAANRNFEFYWFPNTNAVLTKTANLADGHSNKMGVFHYFEEYLLENIAFKVLCEWAHIRPKSNQWISDFSARAVGNNRKVDHSHKVYATARWVRFHEMEYNVPLVHYEKVMQEVIACIDTNRFPVHFPLENRFVKGDDIYLSPAYGRDSAYIACHVYYKKPYQEYFQALESIFKAYEGRPHWGKLHNMNASELGSRYPQMEIFCRHREEQDPQGIFLTPYLSTLLG